MTVVEWPEGVNKKILRNGTSWSGITGFKEDETRSGKRKRRLYASMENAPFSVSMRFRIEEYSLFKEWYRTKCRFGLYAFYFPRIDSVGGERYIYRFAVDGAPSCSNPDGKFVAVGMKWEEVGSVS